MDRQAIQDLLNRADHTLLGQTATWEDIRQLCDDGVTYGCASVCIPPSYVRQAAAYLDGRLPVCTVIGFPNGYSTTAVKCYEAAQAIADGAREIDVVINLGWVKDRLWDQVLSELLALRRATRGQVLKVIIETCYLTQAEKIQLCELVTQSGADYIKTSTGFGVAGAAFEDVALFAAHVGPGVRIKAAGGISTLEDAAEFVALGADRLGTSRIVKLVKQNGFYEPGPESGGLYERKG